MVRFAALVCLAWLAAGCGGSQPAKIVVHPDGRIGELQIDGRLRRSFVTRLDDRAA